MATKKKAGPAASAAIERARERTRAREAQRHERIVAAASVGDAQKVLEAAVGRLTLGKLIRSIREGEEESLSAFGARLGLSAQKLSDIELGRRNVSPERAASYAQKLGYSEAQFVRLALEQELKSAGLRFDVQLTPQA